MPDSIYGIQLFDDIHNYLPEILYNPSRFINVSDLLTYLQEQVDYNTSYNRGMREYNLTRRRREILEQTPPITASIHTIPIRVPDFANIQPQTENILNYIFGRGMNSDALRSFLDTPVIVRPSVEQISNSTTISVVDISRLTDDCSICQDGMIQNEEIRTITHCGHKFHKDCIDVWFQTNVRCPVCRHDIRENTSQSELHPATEPVAEHIAPNPTAPPSPFRSFNNQ